jgi:hypothetical protein
MESICDIRAGNLGFFSVHRPLRDPNKTTETNRLKTGKYCKRPFPDLADVLRSSQGMKIIEQASRAEEALALK